MFQEYILRAPSLIMSALFIWDSCKREQTYSAPDVAQATSEYIDMRQSLLIDRYD